MGDERTGSPIFCVHSTLPFPGSMPTTVPYPGGDVEPPAVDREPAAEAFRPLLVLRRNACRPDPRAAGSGKCRHGAAGIEREHLAVGDDRNALRRPLEEEPVPISTRQDLFTLSSMARWPRLFDGAPPGSGQEHWPRP